MRTNKQQMSKEVGLERMRSMDNEGMDLYGRTSPFVGGKSLCHLSPKLYRRLRRWDYPWN